MVLSTSPFGTRGVREHGKGHRCYAYAADMDRALHIPLNALTISVPPAGLPTVSMIIFVQDTLRLLLNTYHPHALWTRIAQELTHSPMPQTLGMALKQYLPDVGICIPQISFLGQRNSEMNICLIFQDFPAELSFTHPLWWLA